MQLPTGNGATSSRFGCDQTQCYINNYLYPNGNYFYGAIPNPNAGQSVKTSAGVLGPATDVLSVAYTDSTYPLQYYTVTFALSGAQATFTPPAITPNPLPNPWPLPAINDPAVGLKIGDLIRVEGFRAKDGSNNASGDSVTFADGRKVFTAAAEAAQNQ